MIWIMLNFFESLYVILLNYRGPKCNLLNIKLLILEKLSNNLKYLNSWHISKINFTLLYRRYNYIHEFSLVLKSDSKNSQLDLKAENQPRFLKFIFLEFKHQFWPHLKFVIFSSIRIWNVYVNFCYILLYKKIVI